jgi:hypothetical protein
MATFIATLVTNIIIPLVVMIFSFLGAVGGGYLVWWLTDRSEKYKKLYGPLKFNLLMMQLLTNNKEEILEDVKQWANEETQINLMQEHLSPLTLKWIKHSDNIRTLFEENSGLIKKDDFELVKDFMDGYVKREITEQGKNLMAIRESRTDKLLEAISNLQQKLL